MYYFFDYLKKQPRQMTLIMAFVAVCISIMLLVNVLVGNKIAHYNSFYFKNYSDVKSYLEKAIFVYIIETGDMELKFGKNKPVKDARELLENMQKNLIYNGVEYGPYIDNSYSLTQDAIKGKIGLKIIINKDQEDVIDVKVLLDDKNSIDFLNNNESLAISGGIKEYVETKCKRLKFIQFIINISLFILWNALVLIFSLIAFNLARKVSIFRFYALHTVSFVIIISLSIYWIIQVKEEYYSEPPNYLNNLLYLIVTLILCISNKLITHPVLKEISCTGFKKIMTVFPWLPAFLSILIFILSIFVEGSRYG